MDSTKGIFATPIFTITETKFVIEVGVAGSAKRTLFLYSMCCRNTVSLFSHKTRLQYKIEDTWINL
jgi:hypothetical protein